jgi:hypothetical protein
MDSRQASSDKFLPVGTLAHKTSTPITHPENLADFMYICKIKVGHAVMTAMVDTGATFTIMDHEKAISSGYYIHNSSPCGIATLETANNEVVSVEGCINKENISIGNFCAYHQPLLLMRDLTSDVDVILGQNFLMKHQVWIGEGQMIIKHKKGDHTFAPFFFTTLDPIKNSAKGPMKLSALVKHMQSVGRLCLAWFRRDAEGNIQVQGFKLAPFMTLPLHHPLLRSCLPLHLCLSLPHCPASNQVWQTFLGDMFISRSTSLLPSQHLHWLTHPKMCLSILTDYTLWTHSFRLRYVSIGLCLSP